MKILLDLINKLRKAVVLKINDWLEYLRMKKFKRMEASRNEWKEKARTRAEEIREFRKSRRADSERNQKLSAEIRRLKEELKKKT